MNFKTIIKILGKILLIEAGLMILPLIVNFVYGENNLWAFLIPILGLSVLCIPTQFIKTKDSTLYAKEGLAVVALTWILMSLVGAVPFVISGDIPNYIDALFETVSGFTTTGASILTDVTTLSKSIQFWRIFTHWIGGMGVLVFVLAVLPGYNEGIMHAFRAESPGPSVGKLVSKIKYTARILYGIYFVMTVIQVIMLVCGEMNFYESLLHSFSTAGTGGFAIKSDGMASYSTYSQMVAAVFMMLFAVNFNIFYFIIIGKFAKAFRSEEFITYISIIVVSTLVIALNIFYNVATVINFGDAIRLSFFQVTSIGSSTGLATADFNTWPALSKAILIFLTIVGACGGSTGGGIKVSRMIILAKSSYADVRKMINPRSIKTVKFEGEVVDETLNRNVRTYFILWVAIVCLTVILLCIDINDVWTNFTGTLACIGNTGPGFGMVGPMGSYAGYSPWSKLLLSFVMLAGRLEIFPMLILFSPIKLRKNNVVKNQI